MIKNALLMFAVGIELLASSISNAHEKWIVVTTINYPTLALKKLASLEQWRLVVVADKKTPHDWHLDNCVFLSVEDQQKLPYSIISLLPWNHYSRKNIGYLYAIEHGATIIYETDDDNFLITDGPSYLPEKTIVNVQKNNFFAESFNVYTYFNQEHTIWPRGFPLSKITQDYKELLSIQKSWVPIQQGIVNIDPDVDALYRLTHKEPASFSQKKPLCLEKMVFCPFNSQNTVFYKSAFWALLLPVTPSFRTCDIWRSYVMQRLLWDIGAKLCFLAPSAEQYRNEHNLMRDFDDEIIMYQHTDALIQNLASWKSTTPSLQDRMSVLLDTLIRKNFFAQQESALLNAWIHDLEHIGYPFPSTIL